MQFTEKHLVHMYEYMLWGDEKIVEAAATVGDEGYFREQNISAGSIHKLLVHAMAAQAIWLTRWKGSSPTRMEDHTDHPTRPELAARWKVVHQELMSFVRDQTATSLDRIVTYKNTLGKEASLPLGGLMMHVLDHGTYHRGQLNSMIKLAGGKPANIMFVSFMISGARPPQ